MINPLEVKAGHDVNLRCLTSRERQSASGKASVIERASRQINSIVDPLAPPLQQPLVETWWI